MFVSKTPLATCDHFVAILLATERTNKQIKCSSHDWTNEESGSIGDHPLQHHRQLPILARIHLMFFYDQKLIEPKVTPVAWFLWRGNQGDTYKPSINRQYQSVDSYRPIYYWIQRRCHSSLQQKRHQSGFYVIVVKGSWCHSEKEKNALWDIRNNRDLFLILATELRVHHLGWQDFRALDIFLVQQDNTFFLCLHGDISQPGGEKCALNGQHFKK